MPDTSVNQKEFPQPSEQKKGCGFPVASFVGVFCLATGAALEVALGPWFAQDLSLFSLIRHAFKAGDIFLADRGFCSYVDLALLKIVGVDSVVRLHQKRSSDFRRGKILGVLDHVITWSKPLQRSKRVRKAEFDHVPDTFTLRELRYKIEANGFRTTSVTLATTLLDPEAYPFEELTELYFRRWDVELDFRHIKTTMQMDVLRGKSPDVVRKEIWVHLLAYNLMRSIMWESAQRHGIWQHRISFKGAIQQVAVRTDLLFSGQRTRRQSAFRSLLESIANRRNPSRPDRVEPRVRKRRPKNYRLMTRPRSEHKAAIGA